MKIFIRIILLNLIFFFIQCEKENNQDISKTEREYRGSATLRIEYWDYNPYTGQDFFVEEKIYTFPVNVFTKPALSCEGVRETNPFNMSIYPARNKGQDEEGHIDISSCLIIRDPLIGDVILQYWNFTYSGNSVHGTLNDPHTAEAAASNLIWCKEDIAGIPMTMPNPIASGSLMNGSIDGKSCELNIQGNSLDTYKRFTCHLTASR